jgi:hypothetical protein
VTSARYQVEIHGTTGSLRLGYAGIKSTNDATVHNMKISGSALELGIVDINNEYYNTKITSGILNLGHISSGTTYAMTMDYSGAESASMRYFGIKGSDNTEYFRVGYFQNGTNYKRAVWSKRSYISNDYTNDLGSIGFDAYQFIKVTENTNGINIVSDATSRPAIVINTQSASCIDGVINIGSNIGLSMLSWTNHAIYGESANPDSTTGYGVYGIVRGAGNGVYGYSEKGYGGYFDCNTANWPYSLVSAKAAYLATQLYMPNMTTAYTTDYGTVHWDSGNNGITANGRLFRVASSRRFKHDIIMRPINENIYKIEFVDFTYNETGRRTFGSIAEQVAEVYPELVAFNPVSGQPDTVLYEKYGVLALQVVQAQKKEIGSLKTAIEELKKLVDNLIKQ